MIETADGMNSSIAAFANKEKRKIFAAVIEFFERSVGLIHGKRGRVTDGLRSQVDRNADRLVKGRAFRFNDF
jgi:uncharacterized protein YdaU (DUF1376 family)